MYSYKYHPKVKNDLKKIDKPVQKEFIDIHRPKILEDPEISSEELTGDLAGIYSYHFRKNKIEYRASYFIDFSKKIIYFIMIAKRERFYETLKRRLS